LELSQSFFTTKTTSRSFFTSLVHEWAIDVKQQLEAKKNWRAHCTYKNILLVCINLSRQKPTQPTTTMSSSHRIDDDSSDDDSQMVFEHNHGIELPGDHGRFLVIDVCFRSSALNTATNQSTTSCFDVYQGNEHASDALSNRLTFSYLFFVLLQICSWEEAVRRTCTGEYSNKLWMTSRLELKKLMKT
jgi:hypothetical protein